MHTGKVGSSKQLSAALRALVNAGKHGITSSHLAAACGTVAPATVVSALRHNGYDIGCRFERTTPEGKKVYRYTLFAADAMAAVKGR